MHWTDKRRSRAHVAHELQKRGWKLFGYSEDRSDMMTDYYDPADWNGVAEKNGFALVGEVAADRSEYVPTKHGTKEGATCVLCKGSGDDPSSWEIGAAREEPERYSRETMAPGMIDLFPQAVSPIAFGKGGFLKCRLCHGRGHEYTTTETPQPELQWPKFTTPQGRRNWHLETVGGEIIAGGVGLYSCNDFNKGEEQAAAFVDKVEGHITRHQDRKVPGYPEPAPDTEPFHLENGCGVTFTTNKDKNGYELTFSEKPSDRIRGHLKEHKWRWSRRGGLWYKKQDLESFKVVQWVLAQYGQTLTDDNQQPTGPDYFDMAVEDDMARQAGLR